MPYVPEGGITGIPSEYDLSSLSMNKAYTYMLNGVPVEVASVISKAILNKLKSIEFKAENTKIEKISDLKLEIEENKQLNFFNLI